MRPEEIAELAAVYALGGLDGEDRARFEALLDAGDAEAVEALRVHQETLAALATQSAHQPPAALRSALMARIAEDARAGARPPLPARARPRRALWPAVWAGALAAGIAAVVVGLWLSTSYDRRLQALAQEAAVLRAELTRQQAVLAILRDPATQVVALAGQPVAPTARGRMLWHAQAGGILVTTGLPPVPAGKTYQLWAITGQRPPVPAGTFGVDTGGVASLQVPPLSGVERVDVFAVTLEPAGGLPAPSGDMYLAGKS